MILQLAMGVDVAIISQFTKKEVFICQNNLNLMVKICY